MSPADLDQLRLFILAAKRHTADGREGGATVAPLLPGSQQAEYRDGAWLYRAISFGTAATAGQEIVYRDERPVWAMGYAGRVIAAGGDPADERQIHEFLRAALRRVTAERPYRGPASWRDADYVYRDQSRGTVAGFAGDERITRRARKVYELHYSGGLIRP